MTSSKDWNKITPLVTPPSKPPLAHLTIELQFTEAGETLTGLIEREMGVRIANW
jgi:hypothetical protein